MQEHRNKHLSLETMKNKAFHLVAIILLVTWFAYVFFSEHIARALCSDKTLLFQALESADLVFMALMVLAALVIPLGVLLYKYIRTSLLSWKNRAPRPPARKFTAQHKVFALFTLIFTSSILLACWYIVYRHYVTHLESYAEKSSPSYKRPEAPGLRPSEILNLGWAHYQENHPDNSYFLFPEEKKKGAIRIGVFGCSFVHGTEAARGHDLATLLVNEFKNAGYGNVEVINFGVDGYGVHQAYMIWEWAGKRYDLDYTIFLPMEIHESRDRSFVYQNRNYVPVHGRYILDKDDVRLVPVAGSTQRDAEEKYFGFIPPWRYLRYDEKMPVTLFSLIPDKGREAFNPLYYRPLAARKQEILETYRRLFTHLGNDARNAVIVAQDDDIAGLEKKVAAPHLLFLNSTASRYRNSFLYRAPGHHYSAMGQQLQAVELFDFLTGKKNATFEWLKLEKNTGTAPSPQMFKPLCEYDHIQVGIDNTAAAHFGLPTEGNCTGEPRCHKVLDFKKSEIASLLLETDGAIIRYAPMTSPLKDGGDASITFKAGLENVKIPIGTLKAWGGIVGSMSIISPPYTFTHQVSRYAPEVMLENRNMPEFVTIKGVGAKIRDLSVAIDDHTALRGKECQEQKNINFFRRALVLRTEALLLKRYQLLPSTGDYSYLKEGAGEYIAVRSLAENEGEVQLLLYDREGAVSKCPSGLKYRVQRSEGAPFTTTVKSGPFITLKESVDKRRNNTALSQDKEQAKQNK
jgi:hypothetical protein